MHGGVSLLLTGDGSGQFSPVWPDESGLVISGDATAVVTADFDLNGTEDIAVGLTDDEPVLFLNRSSK